MKCSKALTIMAQSRGWTAERNAKVVLFLGSVLASLAHGNDWKLKAELACWCNTHSFLSELLLSYSDLIFLHNIKAKLLISAVLSLHFMLISVLVQKQRSLLHGWIVFKFGGCFPVIHNENGGTVSVEWICVWSCTIGLFETPCSSLLGQ